MKSAFFDKNRDVVMKFNPCIVSKCTDQGTPCEGCGRTHEEIAQAKKLAMSLVSFAQAQGFENHEDFSNFRPKHSKKTPESVVKGTDFN